MKYKMIAKYSLISANKAQARAGKFSMVKGIGDFYNAIRKL